MSKEQLRILELTKVLGMALGALEVISASPDTFSDEGIKTVIADIRKTLEERGG